MSSSNNVTLHGLASDIRACTESETLDLAGHSADTIETAVRDAFREPFVLDSMIRITFVTGGGKQSRQKYDAQAARAVTTELRALGYEEDRSASCTEASAGCFKMQHDTGKNLKTVVVFPMLAESSQAKAAKEAIEPLIPEDSPGYIIAVASSATFNNILKAKCPSWAQKKACIECVEGLKAVVDDLDAALMVGRPLTDSEQVFYDAAENLDDKLMVAKAAAHKQVDSGAITDYEQELLLAQNAERIAAATKGPAREKALQRKEFLSAIDPIPTPKLKYQAEIGKLTKQVAAIGVLDNTGGRLLTIKESQAAARGQEMQDEIDNLIDSSRGWFENDNIFDARVQACRNEHSAHAKKRTNKGGGKSGGSGGGGSVSIGAGTKVKVPRQHKWITPAEMKASKKKKKGGGQNKSVFGAVVWEASDSESEESDNDGDEPAVQDTTAKVEGPAAVSNAASGSKKKSKKKKKKAKSSSEAGDALLSSAIRANQPAPEEPPTALGQVGVIFTGYLLPFIAGVLGWIIGLLFGTKTKKKQR